jgi:GGDEF domain-containing protein
LPDLLERIHDRLIIGAAQCIENSIGKLGQAYRIGGDEFAVLVHAGRQALEESLLAYQAGTEAWAKENGLPLSTSCGCARADEPSDDPSIDALSQIADRRMYQEKARFYQMSGNDRRRRVSDAPDVADNVAQG